MWIEIRTLGRFVVSVRTSEGTHVDLPADALRHGKSRKLFMLLLSQPDKMMMRDLAIELLWPRSTSDDGAHLLSNALWNIRRGLRGAHASAEDIVFATRKQIGLRLAEVGEQTSTGCWLDVKAFDMAYERMIQATSHEEKLNLAWEALALYQGDFLPEAIYDDWTREARERLRRRWAHIGQAAAQVLEQRGEHERALMVLATLLERVPSQSEAMRTVTTLYTRINRGDQAARLSRQLQLQTT